MRGVGASPARYAVGAVTLVLIFAMAFWFGRAGRATGAPEDAVRLIGGVPVGVERTAAGALAAADNYVAVGLTASLDPRSLEAFADRLVAPPERPSLLSASERLAQQDGPPAGTTAIGTVIAHRLRSYTGATARVTTWDLGSYWGAGLAPTQYWAVADLSLRWRDGHWDIASLDERLPGPVPARIAPGADTSTSWSEALAGMSAPYYGAG